ncbi:MAG TPA: PEP-CTERM sorting domain-containing protein, partial [Gemmataceae bacterium]|nr:PEP-CTERM sorting domain-containing protein [Gemmataceae bacterium]
MSEIPARLPKTGGQDAIAALASESTVAAAPTFRPIDINIPEVSLMHRPSLFAVLAALSLSSLAVNARAGGFSVSGSIGANDQSTSFSLGSYEKDNLAVNAGDHTNYDSFGPNQPSYHASSSSYAGADGLHASAHAEMQKLTTGDGFHTFTFGASSAATAVFDDVMISGPAGSGPISVSYNMLLEGSFIVGSNATSSGVSQSGASIVVDFFGQGSNLGGVSYGAISANGGDPTYTSDNNTVFNGSKVLSSPTFSVPVNTPFSIEVQLDAATVVKGFANDIWNLVANTDFGDTLTFVTNGPVFNLPAGYTVNSNEAHISDNSYSVPEPSGLLLMGSATLLLLWRRRSQE